MKPKINYAYGIREKRQYQKFTKPSKTVPDQSMSIPELIRRYASGLPLGAPRIPLYEGEDDITQGINFQRLDLSEQVDIIRNAKKEYDETVSRLRNSKQQKLWNEEKQEKPTEKTPE
jgi:hypothetical protein